MKTQYTSIPMSILWIAFFASLIFSYHVIAPFFFMFLYITNLIWGMYFAFQEDTPASNIFVLHTLCCVLPLPICIFWAINCFTNKTLLKDTKISRTRNKIIKNQKNPKKLKNIVTEINKEISSIQSNIEELSIYCDVYKDIRIENHSIIKEKINQKISEFQTYEYTLQKKKAQICNIETQKLIDIPFFNNIENIKSNFERTLEEANNYIAAEKDLAITLGKQHD